MIGVSETPDDPVTASLAGAVELMLRHAISIGQPLPPGTAEAIALTRAAGGGDLSREETRRLIAFYEALAGAVAPATPATLSYLAQAESSPRLLRFLGPVPFVRRMLLVALLCLAAFVGASLSDEVRAGSGDIFNSSGIGLLLNLIFLIAAAGMGASFAALMAAAEDTGRRAFDPANEPAYWSTFVLGLLGGLMLAELLPIGDGDSSLYTKPLIALLGGFSAKVVYAMLSRFVDAVGSIVGGQPAHAPATPERLVRERAGEEVADLRMQAVAQLVKARERLGDALPDGVFDRIVQGVLQDEPARAADGRAAPEAERPPPG